MLPTPIVRAATQAPKLHPLLYLYPAKKAWPPDFERLTDKHKFRLERKYRRRAKLKYARPQWNKAVKLAQYTSILGILVYGLFGMKWDEQNDSFPGVGLVNHRKAVR